MARSEEIKANEAEGAAAEAAPEAVAEPAKKEPAVPVFYDALFRQRRKHGKYRIVEGPEPPLEAPLADSHCHLASLEHRDLAFAKAALHGVDFLCDITDITEDAGQTYTALEGWKVSARAWIDTISPDAHVKVPHVRLACGCHPHNAKDYTGFVERRLLRTLHDPRTSCVGEVGLDYYYDLSPREVQRRVFRAQVRMAHLTGLPLALHLRDSAPGEDGRVERPNAHDEALAILDEEGFPEAGAILHCCSLGPEELKPWIDRGCYVAYGGALTFKKLDEARAGAKLVPTDRLLTETDCPYMTPEPLRGIENEPGYIVFTAEKLAEVRGIRPGRKREAFLRQLHDNACALLDREPTAWQLSDLS